MKKMFFFFLLFCGVSKSYAIDRKHQVLSDIGPATVTSTTTSNGITISTPTSSFNCLEYIVVRSTNAYTLSVLNNETTFYQITKAASEEHLAPFSVSPICGSFATKLQIKAIPTSGSSVELNYKGYVGR